MKKAIGGLLVSISLLGCSNNYYADTKRSTYNDFNTVASIADIATNAWKANAYSVPKASRQEHESCVFMMLDNGNPGETCTWRTDKASGIVRVARIRPNMCHDLHSTITYKGKSTSWIDIACLQRNKWIFYEQ